MLSLLISNLARLLSEDTTVARYPENIALRNSLLASESLGEESLRRGSPLQGPSQKILGVFGLASSGTAP